MVVEDREDESRMDAMYQDLPVENHKLQENLIQPRTKYHDPSTHSICPFLSLENPEIIKSVRKKSVFCLFLSCRDVATDLEALLIKKKRLT